MPLIPPSTSQPPHPHYSIPLPLYLALPPQLPTSFLSPHPHPLNLSLPFLLPFMSWRWCLCVGMFRNFCIRVWEKMILMQEPKDNSLQDTLAQDCPSKLYTFVYILLLWRRECKQHMHMKMLTLFFHESERVRSMNTPWIKIVYNSIYSVLKN